MKQSHPVLEKELLDSFVDVDKRTCGNLVFAAKYHMLQEKALVHICRDDCRTIGRHDKDFRKTQAPCPYSACNRLGFLIRHFAGCRWRISEGCVHCKRMCSC
ncbi:hypothetical protein MANES_12G113350v8 [Manihot esculenta]|uniref:Uncharacterized protein n=1 Tax=Manihot esculenta TaxID=3983 RepID=A0ACB7GT90_MANES|nr:hypothetical protein MANES_12G113350v8 [Manihot esculenta]